MPFENILKNETTKVKYDVVFLFSSYFFPIERK